MMHMANQDPQPEIYTTRHNFDASATTVPAGTTVTQSIYTNQANNEEVRIYAVAVRIEDQNGATATDFTDFALQIQVGPNAVPSNQFDIGWLAGSISQGGESLAFSSPVLILFQQPSRSWSKPRPPSPPTVPVSEPSSSTSSVNWPSRRWPAVDVDSPIHATAAARSVPPPVRFASSSWHDHSHP